MGEVATRAQRLACLVTLALIFSASCAYAAEPNIGQALPRLSGVNPVGDVKNVEIGSQGATVTVGSGKKIGIDLTALTGGKAGGGSNYIGMGMLFFGLSVLTRLLSTIARIIRPRRYYPRERWVEQ